MSSSTMHNSLAIRLDDLSKIYKLYGSQRDQLIDVLGLQRLGFKTSHQTKEFPALSNISLDIPRGHRIGIVGRNGAGKTTLLKLICGNFGPSSGTVKVNGTVQALMGVGLGFHPEYTGLENIEASLQYNGLGRDKYREAMDGIIEFCELGVFLEQPFKTYSLGMQARLMFATATAIQPDILIVDEVLGAGDAYFVAKSKSRVEKLVSSGCTMLLVSHSMQQVLELCTEVIWLDQGQIRMRDEAFLVVKAYEEHLHGSITQVTVPTPTRSIESSGSETEEISQAPDAEPSLITNPVMNTLPNNIQLQEPHFLPHGDTPELPVIEQEGFHFEAPGGISHWSSEEGIKVSGFSVITERGATDTLVTMRPAKFIITLVAERDGSFDCRYGIALNDHLGVCLTRIFSPSDSFNIRAGAKRHVEILLNPCQVGPGEYTVGISVLDKTPIEHLNSARRYDLLSRSFSIRVELPDSMGALSSAFVHTAEWRFSHC